MILRRFMKHITDQNWFAVGLDVVVVVFGVYLGIYIGEAVSMRALQQDVNEALEVTANTLRGDLDFLSEVVEGQRLGQQSFAIKRAALDPDNPDEKAFAGQIGNASRYTRTFFANRSAYQGMKDNGYLTRIQNPELVLLITDLYDRQYTRIDMNSQTFEESFEHYFNDVLHTYWDLDGEQLIDTSRENIVRLRNGVRKRFVHARYYERRLDIDLKPEIEKVILNIERYLKEQK